MKTDYADATGKTERFTLVMPLVFLQCISNAAFAVLGALAGRNHPLLCLRPPTIIITVISRATGHHRLLPTQLSFALTSSRSV